MASTEVCFVGGGLSFCLMPSRFCSCDSRHVRLDWKLQSMAAINMRERKRKKTRNSACSTVNEENPCPVPSSLTLDCHRPVAIESDFNCRRRGGKQNQPAEFTPSGGVDATLTTAN